MSIAGVRKEDREGNDHCAFCGHFCGRVPGLKYSSIWDQSPEALAASIAVGSNAGIGDHRGVMLIMRQALPAGLSSGDRFGGAGAAREAGLQVEAWRSKL